MVDGQMVVLFLHFLKAFVKPLLTYLEKKSTFLSKDLTFSKTVVCTGGLMPLIYEQEYAYINFLIFLVLISQL